jgi:hypothetical protein
VSMFKTEKFIPIAVADYKPVADELAEHFRQRKYLVESTQLPGGEWQVGITRGGLFKAVLGLKSALKVQIEARPSGTVVRAGAGIFGKQAVPAAVTVGVGFAARVVAWPVVLTQVWGLIRQAGLDDEAVKVVETSLTRAQRAGGHVSAEPSWSEHAPDSAGSEAPTAGSAGVFCTACGGRMEQSAGFCPSCGHARGN